MWRIIDRWRTATATDHRSLGIYRILFAVFVLLTMQPDHVWIADQPPTLFDPPLLSLATLYGSFPARWSLLLLDAIQWISLAFVLVGFSTRLSTIVLLIALIVGNTFTFSFGKVDHSILPLAVLFVMCTRDWGRHYSIDALLRKTTVQREPRTDLVLLGVFVAFGFFSAGYGKALAWLDLDTDHNGFLSWLYQGYYMLGRHHLLAKVAVELPATWVWELADITAVLFELSFFFALFSRSRWYLWLVFTAAFHLVNTLLLNIPFGINIIVLMAFIPWTRLWDALTKWGSKQRFALATIILCCTLAILLLVQWSTGAGNITGTINALREDNGLRSQARLALEWLLMIALLTWTWRIVRKDQPSMVLSDMGTTQSGPQAASNDNDRIILFDGVCNLCNGFVQFIIERDPMGHFRFGTLQGPAAQQLLSGSSLDVEDLRSVIYLRNGQVLSRSTAVLNVLRELGPVWRLTYVFILVPRPLRDTVYRLIARNRYRWFGQRETCMLPTPDLRKRFIDGL